MRALTLTDPALVGVRRTYAQIVLSDSPVGYWPLNDPSGSTAYDATGTRNGTYVGSPTYSSNTGPGGRACYVFNGSNQRVSIGSPVVTVTEPLTFEVWLKYTNASMMTPVSLRSISLNGEVILVITGLSSSNGKVNQFRATGTGSGEYATAANDGTWHHIVVTVNAANNDLILYVDGVARATDSTPGSPTATTSNITLMLGANSSDGTPVQHFAGSMADAAMYGSVLSPTRVAAHYAAGA